MFTRQEIKRGQVLMVGTMVLALLAMLLHARYTQPHRSSVPPVMVREIVRVYDFAQNGDGRFTVLSPSRWHVDVKLDTLAAEKNMKPVMSASAAIDGQTMVMITNRYTHRGVLMPIGPDSLSCQTFIEDVDDRW